MARELEMESRRVALTAIAASLAVVVAMAVFASLRIARPLRSLRAAARAVEQRTLSEPIPVRGRDEIAESDPGLQPDGGAAAGGPHQSGSGSSRRLPTISGRP